MFVQRIAGYPTQSQITELEQVIIAELDQPAQITEPGQAVIYVGEMVNDRGEPGTARVLQAKGELDSHYGGFASWLGSASDGWEGNAYVHLWGVKFPSLIIIPVDLEAGEVTFTGSAPSSDVRIPAGTRISNGSTSIWATLEDLVFAEGAYLDAQDVRVRHVSGASTVLTGAANTILDATLIAAGFTVTNAAGLTGVDLDTAYADAIDVAADETSAAADGTIILASRHTQAVMQALSAHATEASSGGRGRICVISPPIGTTQTTATGSATVGVGARRSDRTVYAWPGVKWLFPQYSSTALVTTHFDAFVASVIAHTPPEQSPGQATGYMSLLQGTESGITPNRGFYKAMKAAGICSLRIGKTGARFIYSAVTSNIADFGKDEIAQRRCSDMIQDAIAGYAESYKDKPLTEANKQGFKDAVDSYLEGLLNPSNQRIAAAATDIDSVNTASTLALGIFYVKVTVRRVPSARYIVLLSQIGANVSVTEAA